MDDGKSSATFPVHIIASQGSWVAAFGSKFQVLKAFGVAVVASLCIFAAASAAAAPARAAWGEPVLGNAPSGVATDGAGNLYVTESFGNRFVKYAPNGTQLMAVGSFGTGQGQFNSPHGVAVESGGAIFVADTGNNRIQRFYPNGSYQTEWGSFGAGLGQFKQPAALAVEGGNVFVADTDNDRVVRCNAWGWCDATFEFEAIGGISSPMGVAADQSGNFYVSDSGNGRIVKSDPLGNVLSVWSTLGAGQGQVDDPAGLALGPGGSIYVADKGNARVQRLSSGGGFLSEWVVPAPLQPARPTAVAIGPGTTINVANPMNNRVDRWDPPVGPTGPTGPTLPTGPTGPTGPTDGPVINPDKPGKKVGKKGTGKKKDKRNGRRGGKKARPREAIISPVKVWREGGGSGAVPGRSVNMKISVKNSGDLAARRVYVYLGKKALAGRPSVEVKRGFMIDTILPGWTVTGTATIFFGKRARGRVAITAQAWGNWGKKILNIRR